MSKEPLMVPFDENGNQMHYPYCGALPPEWRVNTEFRETLRITDFSRGRSAAYFHAEGQSGVKYTIFLTDLFAMLPKLNYGMDYALVTDEDQSTIDGFFTFVKRGQNYGVKHVRF